MKSLCHMCKISFEENELFSIHRQIGGEFRRINVCAACKEQHEADLERTRQNFQTQFGGNDTPVVSAGTDKTVDIHKIIDDAMEKKDRTVNIYISEHGTSIYVAPHKDGRPEWIVKKDLNGYYCPECDGWSRTTVQYCPHCGESLKLSWKEAE